jgi:hypothetical protein
MSHIDDEPCTLAATDASWPACLAAGIPAARG